MAIIQPVRGTSDLLPEEKARQNQVISCAAQTARHFGYADMATPIFEFTEVFSRPLGASSDVVAKETYCFADRGGAGLTLRPEGTAPVMRAVIAGGLTQSLPLRWFYAGPMFRYERPQKGRMRQFHQIGCELIGSASPLADAEIIACGAQILTELNVLSDTKLHLNSLGDPQSRAAYREALVGYLEQYRADLSDDSQRRLETNPLRILDSKSAEDKHILEDAPHLSDYLTAAARAHFEGVTAALDAAGISWHYDPLLVRGLDYYSHTAFEFITSSLGAQGTVLGGGRYDGLSETLGGPPLPAVGFAGGVERLALLTPPAPLPPPQIALIAADEAGEAEAFALACQLRTHAFSTVMILTGNMNKKMKSANKLGCPLVIIIGTDEISRKAVIVRDMDAGTQEELQTASLTGWLDQRFILAEKS